MSIIVFLLLKSFSQCNLLFMQADNPNLSSEIPREPQFLRRWGTQIDITPAGRLCTGVRSIGLGLFHVSYVLRKARGQILLPLESLNDVL